MFPAPINIPPRGTSAAPSEPQPSPGFQPTGFAGRLKQLEDRQEQNAALISSLVLLYRSKDAQYDELNDQIKGLRSEIQALRDYMATLQARRLQAVSGLQHLRVLHIEADTAFEQRMQDIPMDDFEGMTLAWGTMVNTVLNHQQQIYREARVGGRTVNVQPAYPMPYGFYHNSRQAVQTPQVHAYPQTAPLPHASNPALYGQDGLCYAHRKRFDRHFCGPN
ncbi:hypothetical protein CC80DRAFT_473697 [Byssothecium circinans]|uniref:Uncharacterized protein n=1 Tax=Byssothecium circinans TaxID=147558 RepID=A0A6A5U3T4_9PLEO|nr:hypothetical protein CC80DRAFT_473697 [Byssothecium circinans]